MYKRCSNYTKNQLVVPWSWLHISLRGIGFSQGLWHCLSLSPEKKKKTQTHDQVMHSTSINLCHLTNESGFPLFESCFCIISEVLRISFLHFHDPGSLMYMWGWVTETCFNDWVQPHFCFVWPKWWLSQTYNLLPYNVPKYSIKYHILSLGKVNVENIMESAWLWQCNTGIYTRGDTNVAVKTKALQV